MITLNIFGQGDLIPMWLQTAYFGMTFIHQFNFSSLLGDLSKETLPSLGNRCM